MDAAATAAGATFAETSAALSAAFSALPATFATGLAATFTGAAFASGLAADLEGNFSAGLAAGLAADFAAGLADDFAAGLAAGLATALTGDFSFVALATTLGDAFDADFIESLTVLTTAVFAADFETGLTLGDTFDDLEAEFLPLEDDAVFTETFTADLSGDLGVLFATGLAGLATGLATTFLAGEDLTGALAALLTEAAFAGALVDAFAAGLGGVFDTFTEVFEADLDAAMVFLMPDAWVIFALCDAGRLFSRSVAEEKS